MSKLTVTIEACVNGTLTRASARAFNRVVGTNLSGSDTVALAIECARVAGVQYRVVEAAKLAGPDKARHTREVTRSRNAQARRIERKATDALALAS